MAASQKKARYGERGRYAFAKLMGAALTRCARCGMTRMDHHMNVNNVQENHAFATKRTLQYQYEVRGTSTEWRVCLICGKPANESICEHCKITVQAEALAQKRKTEKAC